MPLTPEQIAKMDAAAGIKPATTLTPEKIAQLDAVAEATLGQKASHLAGVVGRAGVTGLAGAASLPADLAVGGINAVASVFDKKPFPMLPSEKFQQDLTNWGAAVPNNQGQRLLSDAVTGVTGGALTGNPVGAFSGLTGGVSAGLTREVGGGPVAQVFAGILGGMSPTNSANVIKNMVSSGVKSLKDVVNPANAEKIGRILVEQADNPQEVLSRLQQAAPEYVPGSLPTLGEVAGDAGLTASQAAFENYNPSALSQVRQSNTAARTQYLDEIAGTRPDLDRAIKERSDVTGPLYKAANSDLVDPAAISPVIQQIDDAIRNVGEYTDAGRVLSSLRSNIQRSLPQRSASASSIVNEFGSPLASQEVTSGGNLGPLVQVYRESRDAAQKAGIQDGAYAASVRGVVKPIISDLGDAIEEQSPNMQVAQQKFREMSAPISQMDELQRIRESATKNQPVDAMGNQALRPSAINNALSIDGKAELSKVLTKDQMDRLENLQKDLNRQSTMRSVRPSGSDTAANLKLNAVIDDIISSKIDKIPFVGKSLKARAQAGVERGLTDAYSNPDEARKAMESALRALQKESIPANLKRVALRSLLGSSVGSLSVAQGKLIMGGDE